MTDKFTELAFTDSVREKQKKYETRALYEKFEIEGATRNVFTPKEESFITQRDGFYVASVGESGWPYMQFRGGPTGFLKVLDEKVLAFADFRGNGQYISAGNIEATGKSVLLLMDYAERKRLKIWAQAAVLHAEDHPEMMARVSLGDYKATVERIFTFTLEAFDWNCPQHITKRYTLDEIKQAAATDPDLRRSCCPDVS